MKSFREWSGGLHQYDDPDTLLTRVEELADALDRELKSFIGERFEGILELNGNVNSLRRTVTEIKTGTAGSTNKWLTK